LTAVLHLRVTVPTDRAAGVVEHLGGTPGVAHLAWLPGARDPAAR